MEALKSSRLREEFTNQEPKMPNENILYMNKENTKGHQKIEKGTLYGLTSLFVNL